MPRDDIVLVLDLECTGNGDDDEIVEIGIVALSMPSLEETFSFTSAVRPSDESFQRMMDNPVVRGMHHMNGLLNGLSMGAGVAPDDVDDMICQWLKTIGVKDNTHIPYGGSGVAHFDRPYIQRQLPRFNKRITYWAYDVGTVRRFFALAGREWMKFDGKTHRALDDARQHAAEFRFAIDAIRDGGFV